MIGLVFSYFFWHYTRALEELIAICRNFLWFTYHFFSIDVLSRTLISPWQRLGEPYKKGSGLTAFFETFVVNTLMRVVGFFVRISVIIVGIAVLIVVFAIEAAVFAAWFALPPIILILFTTGVRLLLNK